MHLREAGAERVVVLEREPAVGTQTTAAGAGFVANWGGAFERGLTRYGCDFYARLQEEDGSDLGVRRSGLLLPALSPAGVELLHSLREVWGLSDDELVWLDADEAVRHAPILARDAIHGAMLDLDSHQLSTALAAAALARRLERLGVEIRTGVTCEQAIVTDGRVSGVATSAGTIPARAVLNAAGAGARALGARNGVAIAAAPLLESRFVTAPLPTLPDELPMLLFFERDLLYLRKEAGGLLVGAVERELAPAARVPFDAPPPVAELSAHALESHERLARASVDLIPLLADAPIATRASGLPTFTPDGRHILGAAPELEGYYVLAGCNEAGVNHGPGLARLIAELIVTGTTREDVSQLRVGRFEALDDDALRAAGEQRYLNRHPDRRAAAR